ncbi:MAG: polyprenol monophosphomannose synthase [Candidatus Bathyarchaeales archaeon]
MNESSEPQIAIILPTYCEAENIANIIRTIEELGLHSLIVVIDDSSPDGTQKIVKQLQQEYKNIVLLTRPFKMGLGTAITAGFRYILSKKEAPEYIITMDADNSHNPEEIPKLFATAKKGYDIAVGSRYCEGGKVKGWKLSRLLISRTANKIVKILLKLPINDFTSGFRCYSRRYIAKALPKLHSQTYEIQIETIRQAKIQNSKVAETPITFQNRKKGKSKLTLTEIAAFSKYILKVIWEQILQNNPIQ